MKINLYNYKNDDNRFQVELENFSFPKFFIKNNVLLLNRILYEDEICERYNSFYSDIAKKGEGIYLSRINEQITKLNGTFFFATNPYTFSTNYFHYTLQSIAPILLAYKMNLLRKNDTIIIDSNFHFQKDLLGLICKYLDIEVEVFVPRNGVIYLIENCIFSEFLFGANFHYSVIDVFEDIASYLYSDRKKFPKNIYISRKDSRIRKMSNEDIVISLMSKNGYRIIDNSKLSIIEQIQMFASAKNIVAPHGAGLTNLLYALEDINVTELFSENRFPIPYINLCSQKNCIYSATVNKALRDGYPDAAYTVDINLLKKALEKPLCTFKKLNKEERNKVINNYHKLINNL